MSNRARCIYEYLRYKRACKAAENELISENDIEQMDQSSLEANVIQYRQMYIALKKCLEGRVYVNTQCYNDNDTGHLAAIEQTREIFSRVESRLSRLYGRMLDLDTQNNDVDTNDIEPQVAVSQKARKKRRKRQRDQHTRRLLNADLIQAEIEEKDFAVDILTRADTFASRRNLDLSPPILIGLVADYCKRNPTLSQRRLYADMTSTSLNFEPYTHWDTYLQECLNDFLDDGESGFRSGSLLLLRIHKEIAPSVRTDEAIDRSLWISAFFRNAQITYEELYLSKITPSSNSLQDNVLFFKNKILRLVMYTLKHNPSVAEIEPSITLTKIEAFFVLMQNAIRAAGLPFNVLDYLNGLQTKAGFGELLDLGETMFQYYMMLQNNSLEALDKDLAFRLK